MDLGEVVLTPIRGCKCAIYKFTAKSVNCFLSFLRQRVVTNVIWHCSVSNGRFERTFCRCANDNLCVTNAMNDDLTMNWGLQNVTTLYDRAADVFKETSVADKHEVKQEEESPSIYVRNLINKTKKSWATADKLHDSINVFKWNGQFFKRWLFGGNITRGVA